MTTAELARPESGIDTSSLQMIRADLDIREFHRWAGMRGLISRAAFDEGFAMHCLLVESFGELTPKPFRVIMPRVRGKRVGTLYGYSRYGSGSLRDAAALYCDPQQAKILPASRIDSKPMPAEWQSGKRLGFEVLLRPTIRRARGSDRAGKECDAFQAEAEKHGKGMMPRTREEVYADWLRARLESRGATRLESATLAMFQRTRAVRKLHARPSEGPQAVMRGTLTISDPSEFGRLLANGIGRHKAYGYGMLLLRPPMATPAGL